MTFRYILSDIYYKVRNLFKLFRRCNKVIQANFPADMAEKAQKNFENIKESIKGLYDFLNIGLEDEIYLEIGKDNVFGLYKNVIELLLNDYGLRKLVKKIRNSELEVEIVLDESLIENSL